MKRALIALLMLAAMPSFANQWNPKFCSDIYDFAHLVMTERQKGASSSALMKLAKGDSVRQAIVRDALKVPVEPTPIKGKLAAADYAYNEFLMCVEYT